MFSLSLDEDTLCGLLSKWMTTGHFFSTMMGQDLPDAGKSSADRHLSMLKKCAIMNRQDCSFKKLQLRLVLTTLTQAGCPSTFKQFLLTSFFFFRKITVKEIAINEQEDWTVKNLFVFPLHQVKRRRSGQGEI
jgi:hypothetical protein